MVWVDRVVGRVWVRMTCDLCVCNIPFTPHVCPTHPPLPLCLCPPPPPDVSFSYPNAPTAVLHHVTLNLEMGERIALIGANGQGKSTLVKLIMGMDMVVCV